MQKKYITLTIIIILVAGGTALLLQRRNNGDSEKNPDSSINYTPPTKEEQAAGDQQKEKNVANNNVTSQPASAVQVVISDASQYGSVIEVRALITNILEDGNCTVTLRNGNLIVTKTVGAFKDANTSQCSAADFSRDQFGNSGSWSVSVEYKSASGINGTTTGTVEIK